jgi:hypothetical protein
MRVGASIALLFGILAFGSANAADISGIWQGKINNQYVLKISAFGGEDCPSEVL